MKYIKAYKASRDKSLITYLDLSSRNLTELPDLSDYTNLKELHCYNNQLTYLPELPDTLEELSCDSNILTSLPKLPNNIKRLFCQFNQLSSLPELPNTLKILYCHCNKLTSIPELPNKLTKLYCHNNQLTSLPELPDTLDRLTCYNNQIPFENLDGYKKWYEENKYIIDKEGLEYAYQLSKSTNKYNL